MPLDAPGSLGSETTVETGDHTTARSQNRVKVLLQRWWAPGSRQWSNGTGKLRCLVSGASTFIGGTPSLLSCRPRPPIMPGTRQAHSCNAPMALLNLSHGLLALWHAPYGSLWCLAAPPHSITPPLTYHGRMALITTTRCHVGYLSGTRTAISP